MSDSKSANTIAETEKKFRAAHTRGETPDLIAFLETVELHQRAALLEKLLPIDVEFRSLSGSFDVNRYSSLGQDVVAKASELALRWRPKPLLEPNQSELRKNTIVVRDVETNSDQAASPTRKLPEQIDNFKLLKKLGEGGMGTVWEAEQLKPVRRKVAVKVIRGDLGSEEVVVRFEAERQALAIMDHQNIARVYDAGTTAAGNPYFVMELVHGTPLNEFCDANQLNCRQRLQLVRDVCYAVQHAHQKGVIHRDLKPANVLVCEQDGKFVPKVIDFGLSKALATSQVTTDREVTQAGQILGTLEYMSPEQAGLNASHLDTRSDIYSLGVILFEQLTGVTPLSHGCLKTEPFDRIIQHIREADTVLPSRCIDPVQDELSDISRKRNSNYNALRKTICGDLDWVTMKALEKDLERRYSSAGALGDEIDRYLKNEPIEARPPSPLYLINKCYQRNKGKFVAAVIMVGLVVCGLLATLWQWQQTVLARNESRILAESEKTARAEASQAAIDIANTIAAAVRNSMLEGNGDAVREILRDIRRDLPRAEIRIYDPHGFDVFSLDEKPSSANDLRPDFLEQIKVSRAEIRRDGFLHHPILNKDNCRGCHAEGDLRGVLVLATDGAPRPIDSLRRENEVITSLIKSGFIQLMTADHQNIVEAYVKDIVLQSDKVSNVTIYGQDGQIAFGDQNALASQSTVRRALDGEQFVIENDDAFYRFEPLPNEDRCKGCHNDDEAIRGALLVSTVRSGQPDTSLAAVTHTTLEHIMLTGLGRLIARYLDDERATGAVSKLVLYDSQGKVYHDSFAAPQVPEAVQKALAEQKSIELEAPDENTYIRLMHNEKRCQQCHGSDLPVRGAVEVRLKLQSKINPNFSEDVE